MSRSANDAGGAPSRREQTRAAITRCARSLATAHGLDGFTMEDLAAEVGVSRRTLFNHFPSKFDAVLGPRPESRPDLLEVFLAGGPSGDLLTDLKSAALLAVGDQAVDVAEAEQLRLLVRADPRLFAALHERFAEVAEFLTATITQREGAAADPLRTQIALKLLLGLFDTALDESLADPSIDFEDHFERVFAITARLFAG